MSQLGDHCPAHIRDPLEHLLETMKVCDHKFIRCVYAREWLWCKLCGGYRRR